MHRNAKLLRFHKKSLCLLELRVKCAKEQRSKSKVIMTGVWIVSLGVAVIVNVWLNHGVQKYNVWLYYEVRKYNVWLNCGLWLELNILLDGVPTRNRDLNRYWMTFNGLLTRVSTRIHATTTNRYFLDESTGPTWSVLNLIPHNRTTVDKKVRSEPHSVGVREQLFRQGSEPRWLHRNLL
jgi:hypothetical protein